MAIYTDVEFVVAGDEVDLTGKLFLDKLIEKLQMSNNINSESIGFTKKLFEEQNISWMLVNNEIKLLLDLPSIGDKIIIETVPAGSKGAKLYREDRVFLNEKHEDNLIAINGSVWIIADKDTHEPKRPNKVMAKEELESKSDLTRLFSREIVNLKEIENYGEPSKASEYVVAYSDLDSNRHFHNTNYVRLGINAFAEKKGFNPNKNEIIIKSLNIRYIKEVFMGEKIEVYVLEDSSHIYAEGRTENGEVSFIIKCELELREVEN